MRNRGEDFFELLAHARFVGFGQQRRGLGKEEGMQRREGRRQRHHETHRRGDDARLAQPREAPVRIERRAAIAERGESRWRRALAQAEFLAPQVADVDHLGFQAGQLPEDLELPGDPVGTRPGFAVRHPAQVGAEMPRGLAEHLFAAGQRNAADKVRAANTPRRYGGFIAFHGSFTACMVSKATLP